MDEAALLDKLDELIVETGFIGKQLEMIAEILNTRLR
jgi:hypothetical protein